MSHVAIHVAWIRRDQLGMPGNQGEWGATSVQHKMGFARAGRFLNIMKSLRDLSGGLARNRTGVQGFAVLCVTTPPRGRPFFYK